MRFKMLFVTKSDIFFIPCNVWVSIKLHGILVLDSEPKDMYRRYPYIFLEIYKPTVKEPIGSYQIQHLKCFTILIVHVYTLHAWRDQPSTRIFFQFIEIHVMIQCKKFQMHSSTPVSIDHMLGYWNMNICLLHWLYNRESTKNYSLYCFFSMVKDFGECRRMH